MAAKPTQLEVYKTLKTDKERQSFVEMQFSISVALQRRIKQLDDEVKHLQELLASTTALVPIATPIIVTPEEGLIDKQLSLLEEQHRGGQSLSLEDTKKLDLLIKNKRLLREQTTTIQGESKPVKGKHSTAELAQLAAKGEEIV